MADVEPGRPWPHATLVATSLGLFMIKLDVTVVNVALPDLQADFGVGEQGLQWVVAAYSLAMCAFVMAGAVFADRRGRRLAYLVGIAAFSVASLACGLAPSIGFLGIARGVQGTGAAIINVASLALLVNAYDGGAAKAKAIGAWTGISAVGYAVGPTVGGILTTSLGWRSIFLVNPLVGIVAVALTLRFVAESRDPVHRRFDGWGQALFVSGLGLLTFVLIEAPHLGLTPGTAVAGAVAAGLLAVFGLVEWRRPDAMMDLHLFSDRVYTVAIVTIFAVLFTVYGTLLLVTQYFQNIRGYGPIHTGLLMLSMTAPSVVAAPIAGRMTGRYGARLPTLLGVGAICAGTLLLATTTGGAVIVTLAGLALTGVAGSLAVAPATTIAMRAVPADRSGMASGIIGVQRALGSTAGFAVMGSVLAAVISMQLPHAFEPALPDRSERQVAVDRVVADANPRAVAAVAGPGKPLPESVAGVDELLSAADRTFVTGMRAAWLFGFLVVVATFVAGWFVLPRPDPSGSDRARSET